MQPVFPIFVSSGRAGLTLLRLMFDSHPDLAVAHEPRFLPSMSRNHRRYEREGRLDIDRFLHDIHQFDNFRRAGLVEADLRAALSGPEPAVDFADAVRRVFTQYAVSRGKPLYAVKEPLAVSFLEPLADLFPEARFVHLIRDGRDVAVAYLERDKGPATIADAAFHWRLRVARGHRDGRQLGPDRYGEFHYEELVDDHAGVLDAICRFLDLRFEGQMLDYAERAASFLADAKHPSDHQHVVLPPTKGLIDWRRDMSTQDVALFETIAGDVLESVGYERSSPGAASRLAVAREWIRWWYRRITWRLKWRLRRGRAASPDRP